MNQELINESFVLLDDKLYKLVSIGHFQKGLLPVYKFLPSKYRSISEEETRRLIILTSGQVTVWFLQKYTALIFLLINTICQLILVFKGSK
jgi:hypothetical protein